MKKLSNSIKIGFIRRSEISSEPPNGNQPSLKNHHVHTQQEPQYRDLHQQVLGKKVTNNEPAQNVFHDPRYILSPRAIRPFTSDESNGIHNGEQHNGNVPNSVQSPSSTPPERTTANLKEISSTAKWSTRKKVLLSLAGVLLISILVVVPTVLGVLLTRQTATTTTTTPTTTISSIVVSASWPFDNATTDVYNVYNGILMNGATYSANGTGQPYVGYARALYLTASLNQSVLVSSPFLDLTYTSFTIEAWIYYITTFTGDRGIFGQCQCPTCSNQCLYFILRANRLYAGFTLNDIASLSTITVNTWYHVAFVYNYQTQQQILYLNGVQDTTKSNAQPYQGTNATIQIGVAQVFQTTNFFNGYIDNVNIVTRAKSSTEILKDASLCAYYSFDIPNSTSDSGPNGLNGTSVNTVTVSGRVNQAMRLTGSSSYFQAYGFYQFGYATILNRPFSISMWINPSSFSSSVFLQMATAQTSSSCFNMMGFISSTGFSSQLIAQGYTTSGAYISIFGPYVSINTWTHISWTFSSTNGYTLYINGNLFGSTGTSSSFSFNQMIWLTLGYNFVCNSNYMSNTGYQGSIDEAYFHSRELTQADVTAFANP